MTEALLKETPSVRSQKLPFAYISILALFFGVLATQASSICDQYWIWKLESHGVSVNFSPKRGYIFEISLLSDSSWVYVDGVSCINSIRLSNNRREVVFSNVNLDVNDAKSISILKGHTLIVFRDGSITTKARNLLCRQDHFQVAEPENDEPENDQKTGQGVPG